MNHASACNTKMVGFESRDTLETALGRQDGEGATSRVSRSQYEKKTRGNGTTPLRVKRDIEDVSSELDNGVKGHQRYFVDGSRRLEPRSSNENDSCAGAPFSERRHPANEKTFYPVNASMRRVFSSSRFEPMIRQK
ncbi:hypothetical protein TNCV_774451 [Trichonephila clavipes]|nr:hypothetical protein TNCV_774451 [Trichonephila clavipes]